MNESKRVRNRRASPAALAAIALAGLAVTQDAVGQTAPPYATWTGRAGGDYEDSLLWRSSTYPGAVPAEALPGTVGVFGVGAAVGAEGGVASEYSVNLHADASRLALRVAGSSMDLDLGGHTLTLSATSINPNFAELVVNSFTNRTSRLRIENGSIVAPKVVVQSSSGDPATLEIGDGGELTVGTVLRTINGATLRLDGGTLTVPAAPTDWRGNIPGFDFVRGTLNVPHDEGAHSLATGQHMNVSAPVTTSAPVTLNGGSYSAPSISGPVILNSGKLSVTNGSLDLINVQTGGHLAAGQAIDVSGDLIGQINLAGGTLSAGQASGPVGTFTAGELNITGGSFSGSIPNNRLNAGQTLRVRDSLTAVPQLTGGHLAVGQIRQAPSLFTSGTLEITGSNLYIGDVEPDPADSRFLTSSQFGVAPNASLIVAGTTTVGSAATLAVSGRFQTDHLIGKVRLSGPPSSSPQLIITSGGLIVGGANGQLLNTWLPRSVVRVGGDIDLHDDLTVNGGTFQAARITGSADASLTFQAGQLLLTDSDLDLSSPRITIPSVGFTGLPAGTLVEVSGETRAVQTPFFINGGTWRTGTLNGLADLRSGTLHITNGDFDLTTQLQNAARSNAVLQVDGALTDSGPSAEATITDLAVVVERLAPRLGQRFRIGNNASLRLTGSDLVIGNGQPLGNSVTLAPTQALVVDGTTTIESFASLTINGGSFTTGDLYVRDSGSLTFVDGEFTVTGATSISEGAMLDLGDSTIVTDRLRLHGGTLGGSGTVAGGLYNDGVVAPGNSPGIIHVEGNYDQYGTLLLELAGTAPGTQFDQLQATGVATLSGTVELVLLDGYVPNPGDVFDLVTAASIVDQAFTLTHPEGLYFAQNIVPAGDGYALRLTYVPEPGAVLLWTAAVAPLLSRRRRR